LKQIMHNDGMILKNLLIEGINKLLNNQYNI